MKYLLLFRVALGVTLFALVAGPSNAGMITAADVRWMEDDAFMVAAVINHGAITADTTEISEPFTVVSPSGFWRLTFDQIQQLDVTSGDGMVLRGNLRHLHPPPGHDDEEAGEPLTFPLLRLDADVGEMRQLRDTASDRKPHAPHEDVLRASLVATVSALDGTQITSWDFTARGRHIAGAVPEPRTLLLVGIGTIPLLACAWRRRK
jgi:hypothetical protein